MSQKLNAVVSKVRAGGINHVYYTYRERSAEESRLRTAILDLGRDPCDFIKHAERKMREVIQQYGKQMKYWLTVYTYLFESITPLKQ